MCIQMCFGGKENTYSESPAEKVLLNAASLSTRQFSLPENSALFGPNLAKISQLKKISDFFFEKYAGNVCIFLHDLFLKNCEISEKIFTPTPRELVSVWPGFANLASSELLCSPTLCRVTLPAPTLPRPTPWPRPSRAACRRCFLKTKMFKNFEKLRQFLKGVSGFFKGVLNFFEAIFSMSGAIPAQNRALNSNLAG